MSCTKAWSIALVGMQGVPVEVEVALGQGLPRTVLVGLPDTALYEARDRCRAAVASSGRAWPSMPVTINLSPATLPKHGSHYDLAIVAAVLAAAGAVPSERLSQCVLLGELGLDSKVRPVRGLLPALVAARGAGFDTAVVPAAQYAEASLISGLTAWPVACLADLIAVLNGDPVEIPVLAEEPDSAQEPEALDLADVYGQEEAKWALEVAAAGGHHVYFHGPPGVGKTMLARRMPGILPQLSVEDALEVAAIRSLCSDTRVSQLDRRAPFSAPHHTASTASLVGGGARIIRPGAISLSHLGVLFLDEAPEFSSRSLEALRTPLETGEVTISRAEVSASFPAQFQLILAANPCPCGNRWSTAGNCTCTPTAVRRYAQRISGPIRDRIDIHQWLAPNRIRFASGSESSERVAERVLAARQRQQYRYRDEPWQINARTPPDTLRRLPGSEKVQSRLEDLCRTGTISARGAGKMLRLAWTMADLRQAPKPELDDLELAVALRNGEERMVAV